jgi:hypothetical protein
MKRSKFQEFPKLVQDEQQSFALRVGDDARIRFEYESQNFVIGRFALSVEHALHFGYELAPAAAPVEARQRPL